MRIKKWYQNRSVYLIGWKSGDQEHEKFRFDSVLFIEVPVKWFFFFYDSIYEKAQVFFIPVVSVCPINWIRKLDSFFFLFFCKISSIKSFSNCNLPASYLNIYSATIVALNWNQFTPIFSCHQIWGFFFNFFNFKKKFSFDTGFVYW